MSRFEIIRGIEGCCLALDDTRIAGPKPWGGGSVIHAWETDKEYKAVNTQSLWYKLFGTPERATRTMITAHNVCETTQSCYPNCPLNAAPWCPGKSWSNDYGAMLKWLRGDAE